MGKLASGKESLTTLGGLNKKELRPLPLHPPPPPPPPLPPPAAVVTQTVVDDSTLGAGRHTVAGGQLHILAGRHILKIKFKFKS